MVVCCGGRCTSADWLVFYDSQNKTLAICNSQCWNPRSRHKGASTRIPGKVYRRPAVPCAGGPVLAHVRRRWVGRSTVSEAFPAEGRAPGLFDGCCQDRPEDSAFASS